MKPFLPRALACSVALAAAAALSVLPGCSMQEAGDGSEVNDPFPKPLGDSIIPLGQEAYSNFKYVEFDTAGGLFMRLDLELRIIPKLKDVYGYAFEDPRSGTLLSWKDGNGNRDSAGIYIVGRYRDTDMTIDSNPVIWLPQFPKPGVTWSIGPGRNMQLVSQDTAFYTEILFRGSEETAKAPIVNGFQKHHAIMFRETYGDTLSIYYFRRGVGCLGFERSVGGKLLATGYIQTFSRTSRYPYSYGG